MKAVVVKASESLEHVVVQEIPVPVIKPNQVLVQVKACGLNPIDWKGVLHSRFVAPYIMGSDIAGIVVEVGAHVQQFAVGDKVIGSLHWATQGAFAQYVATEPQYLCAMPAEYSFEQAAAIPLAALTAWQALFEKLQIKPNERVLIQAAAGGVGHLAVQLALWKGAEVVAVASKKNHDFLKQLGVKYLVDYTEGFEGLTNSFDAVLDCTASFDNTIPLLKKGGRYVTLTAKPSDELVAQYQVQAHYLLFQSNQQHLQQIVNLIEAGVLCVFVNKIFNLSNVVEALEYQHTGHSIAKNVLVF